MRLIFTTLIICCTLSSFGQTFGVKIGYGISNYSSDTINIQNFNGQDTLNIWLDHQANANYTGFFIRLPLEPFYFEIEPVLSRFKIPVKVQNIQTWNGGSITQYEQFTSIDLSLIFGVRFWEFLRLQGGVTSQYYIGLNSDLAIFSTNYSNEWEQYVQSWKVGLGIDSPKVSIEANYENPFVTVGNNINFFDKDYQLNINRRRFELKLGIALINVLR